MTDAIAAEHTPASTLWIMLLTVASTATTLVFACATPFPALAALAAAYMRRRDGVLLALAAWVASQAVGFCVLDYPRDAGTMLWGVAIGTAAIAGALAAHAAADRATGRAGKLIAGYLAAFLLFKLVILFWSVARGDVGQAFALDVMLRQFGRNAVILVGMLALYRVLIALGVPSANRVATA